MIDAHAYCMGNSIEDNTVKYTADSAIYLELFCKSSYKSILKKLCENQTYENHKQKMRFSNKKLYEKIRKTYKNIMYN